MERLACWVLLFVILGALPGCGRPEHTRHNHDAQIAVRLPEVVGVPAPGQSLSLEAALSGARALLAESRRSGDLRLLGRARGLLEPWWADPAPSRELRVVRAWILQSHHRFDEALHDLAAVLDEAPHHAEARLGRAMIHRARGALASGRRDCQQTYRAVAPLVTATCLGSIDALTDRAGAARARLERLLAQIEDADDPAVGWALSVAAELARQTGDEAAAAVHLQQLEVIAPGSLQLQIDLAEHLLDTGSYQAVVDRFSGRQPAPLLLRRAIARRALHAPAWRDDASRLMSTLDAGSDPVSFPRIRARAELHLFDSPAAALALALESWRQHREPRDARLVLEAALASGRPEAGADVLAWIRHTGYADVRLTPLLDSLAASA